MKYDPLLFLSFVIYILFHEKIEVQCVVMCTSSMLLCEQTMCVTCVLRYVQTMCCYGYKRCVTVRIRSDIYVEVEAAVGSVNGTDGIFVAARVEHGGCSTYSAKGLFFFLFPKMQTYIVAYDLGKSETALLLGSW